jgi:hypothetical protein
MRAGTAVVLAALTVGAAAQPARATPQFIVGTGQNPGVAVDAVGTAYIGWKVNVYAPQGVRRTRAKRTATVRLVPRHGRARTVRYSVRGCGRIA